jgi:signal peptidase I
LVFRLGSDKSERAAADDHGSWKDTGKVIVQALALALVVRIFFYQPFNIPSGSMKPTLLVGDYLFVSKLSYGYSSLSLFGGTIGRPSPSGTTGRYFATLPKRGDVAVFKLPRDNTTDYIKRVIGLPGDKIQVRAGVVYLNDKAIPKRPTGTFVDIEEDGVARRLPRFEEELPNGVKYTVLDAEPNGPGDNTDVYVVPPGHFFMMGDNRDNSTDSRFIRQVGFVPFDNLVGRADIIFFSTDSSCGYAPDSPFLWRFVKSTVCSLTTGVRFGRLLNLVR